MLLIVDEVVYWISVFLLMFLNAVPGFRFKDFTAFAIKTLLD